MLKNAILMLVALCAFAAPCFAGDEVVGPVAHERAVRKEMQMPPEWFACKKSEDCAISNLDCEGTLAVRLDHKEQADRIIAEKWANKFARWKDGCDASVMPATSAVCDNGECIGHYEWH